MCSIRTLARIHCFFFLVFERKKKNWNKGFIYVTLNIIHFAVVVDVHSLNTKEMKNYIEIGILGTMEFRTINKHAKQTHKTQKGKKF